MYFSIHFEFHKIFGPIVLLSGSLKHNVTKVFLSHILLISDSLKLFDPIVLINWRFETQCNHNIFEIVFDFSIFKKYLTPLCFWLEVSSTMGQNRF